MEILIASSKTNVVIHHENPKIKKKLLLECCVITCEREYASGVITTQHTHRVSKLYCTIVSLSGWYRTKRSLFQVQRNSGERERERAKSAREI